MRNTKWFLLLAGAMTLHAQPASAGFEWRAPSSAPAAMESPAEPVAPAPVPLAPVAAETVQSMISPPAPAAQAYEGVESFGKDIGIAVALRQIVPSDYQYALGPGVDPAQKLSWEGQGQPWPEFLNETLAPHGLKAYVRDNIVVVASADAAPSSASKTVPPMQTITAAPAMPLPAPVAPPADQTQITWDDTRDTPLAIYKAQAQAEEKTAAPPKEAIAWEDAMPVAPVAPPPLEERTVVAPAMPPEEPAYNPPPAVTVTEPVVPPATAPTAPQVSAQVSMPPAPAGERVEVTVSQAPAWVAPQGALLRDVLKNWTAQAGVRLFWSIDYDYRLSRDIELSGSFETAVQAVLDSFAGVYPRPVGKLYTGSSERVLVISSPDLLS